jgi:DNA-directed RNA polymerase specialized sigma24 family protein
MIQYLSPQSKKHRGLTSEAFEHLLAALSPHREVAGEQYEQIRATLVLFFTFRGASDPHELADETINRAAGRLHLGAIISTQNPVSYFYGIARNVWREMRARPVVTEPLEVSFSPHRATSLNPQEVLEQEEQAQQAERRLQCLGRCLQKLSAADRELMLAYYQGTGSDKIENRQELAAHFNISLKTLRNKTSRLRGQIAECVKHCLTGTPS